MQAAFISGGAKRLGAAFAIFLAKQRYDLALHFNSSEAEAEILKQNLEENHGIRVKLYQTNLSDPLEVEVMMQKVLADFPDLKLVINNASVFYKKNIEDTDFRELEHIFRINFTAPYIINRALAKVTRCGVIVNMLDSHINRNQNVFAAYQLSKKATADLTKMCAKEFAPGIRVNGIAPGLILPVGNEPESYLDKMINLVPLKKMGEVENILQTLDFILKNDYLTGQILSVDGGKNITY